MVVVVMVVGGSNVIGELWVMFLGTDKQTVISSDFVRDLHLGSTRER